MSLDALLDAQFKTPPWQHQLAEFETSCDAPSRALLWQMRSGKSKMVLDTASHLYRAGAINTLLVFAPNGVHENWVTREAPIHMWDSVDYTAQAWQTRIAGKRGGNQLSRADRLEWDEIHAAWWADYKASLRAPQLQLVTFNSESMARDDCKKAIGVLLKRRKVMAVWDESTDFRTPGSARTLMARAIARRVAYRRILDGTSLTNSPLHAFAQFELLAKAALGFNRYSEFKEHFAEWEEARGAGGRKYPKLAGYKNLEELRALIAPYSSVVLREDCDDMPNIMPRLVQVEMSANQARAYDQVKEQLRIELGRGEVAELKARTLKLQKLQQVASGFLIDAEGKARRIPGPNPRLDKMAEEVYHAPGKIIVWCQFHEEIDQVAERLKAEGHVVWEYHGRVQADRKAYIRAHFNTDEKVKVLVGQPQAGGRGVDFSDADSILWYGHTFDAIIRAQANERATKVGGRNIQMIMMAAAPIDHYIMRVTDRKTTVGDDLAGRGLKQILQEL